MDSEKSEHIPASELWRLIEDYQNLVSHCPIESKRAAPLLSRLVRWHEQKRLCERLNLHLAEDGYDPDPSVARLIDRYGRQMVPIMEKVLIHVAELNSPGVEFNG